MVEYWLEPVRQLQVSVQNLAKNLDRVCVNGLILLSCSIQNGIHLIHQLLYFYNNLMTGFSLSSCGALHGLKLCHLDPEVYCFEDLYFLLYDLFN